MAAPALLSHWQNADLSVVGDFLVGVRTMSSEAETSQCGRSKAGKGQGSEWKCPCWLRCSAGGEGCFQQGCSPGGIRLVRLACLEPQRLAASQRLFHICNRGRRSHLAWSPSSAFSIQAAHLTWSLSPPAQPRHALPFTQRWATIP